MDYDRKADSLNASQFARTVLRRLTDSPMYNCVLCGCKTSIENSCSRKGHKLTCLDCIKTRFDSHIDFIVWVHKEN